MDPLGIHKETVTVQVERECSEAQQESLIVGIGKTRRHAFIVLINARHINHLAAE